MNAKTFLNDLQTTVSKQTELVKTDFKSLGLQQLNYKPGTDSWSILECLEHLNRYSRYYLPRLREAIMHAQAPKTPDLNVEYSWLGKYSINFVKPANGKKNKTLKHMNPNNSLLTKQVLDEFLQHQETLSSLLTKALKIDINRKTVPIEFMRLFKIKTGETLEFVALHQERHIKQAQRVLAKIPNNTDAVLVM